LTPVALALALALAQPNLVVHQQQTHLQLQLISAKMIKMMKSRLIFLARGTKNAHHMSGSISPRKRRL